MHPLFIITVTLSGGLSLHLPSSYKKKDSFSGDRLRAAPNRQCFYFAVTEKLRLSFFLSSTFFVIYFYFQGRGVVGSTSNILGFIKDQTKKAVGRGGRGGTAAVAEGPEKLSFVLGTESGMITSIVRAVQQELRAHPSQTQVYVCA